MFNFLNSIPHELKRLNQSLELNFEAGNSKKSRIDNDDPIMDVA